MATNPKGKEWRCFYLSTKKVNLRDYHVWYKACVMAERRAIIDQEVAYKVRQVFTLGE